MTDRKRQMVEDRNLRDAAKAIVESDIAHIKSELSAKGIGERMIGSVGEGAADVLERASEAAETHKGVLAALLGAVVLWFARNPIAELFSEENDDSGGERSEPGAQD